jgi:hypothetical protein
VNQGNGNPVDEAKIEMDTLDEPVLETIVNSKLNRKETSRKLNIK